MRTFRFWHVAFLACLAAAGLRGDSQENAGIPPSSAPELADLWVEAIPPGGSNPKSKLHIWNTGTKSSGPFQVAFTLREACGKKMAAGKPISLKPISIKDLEPDKVQIHLFPDGTFKAKCRYTVGVSIDPANTVSESNESNNSDNMAW
jgi:hypothetical protein